MSKLLRFEFRKLFTKPKFYIIMAICFGFVCINALIQNLAISLSSEIAANYTNYHFITSFVDNSFLLLLSSIFVSIFICEDYSNDTMKNIYARGFSRRDVFASKLIVVAIANTILFVLSIIESFALSVLFSSGEMPEKFIESILVQYLLFMALTTLYYAISMIFSRLAIVICFNIVGPSIISLLISAIDLVVKNESFAFSSLWLENAMTNVSKLSFDSKYLWIGLGLALAYGALFTVGGYFIVRKKEAK